MLSFHTGFVLRKVKGPHICTVKDFVRIFKDIETNKIFLRLKNSNMYDLNNM